MQFSFFFQYIYKVVQPSPLLNSRIFSSAQGEALTPLAVTPHSILPHPLVYALSLYICLFWAFYINRIIQYIAFCVWLLSLSTMSSSFIHMVAWIGTSFLISWIIFHWVDVQLPIYLCISWWTLCSLERDFSKISFFFFSPKIFCFHSLFRSNVRTWCLLFLSLLRWGGSSVEQMVGLPRQPCRDLSLSSFLSSGSFILLCVLEFSYTGLQMSPVSLKMQFVYVSSFGPCVISQKKIFVPPSWNWTSTNTPLISLCSFI